MSIGAVLISDSQPLESALSEDTAAVRWLVLRGAGHQDTAALWAQDNATIPPRGFQFIYSHLHAFELLSWQGTTGAHPILQYLDLELPSF